MSNFNKISRLAFLGMLLPLLLLAGCGTKSEALAPLPNEINRFDLLRSFVLLDEQGRELPPRSPRGNAPFAALLKLPERGDRGQCSATHLGGGVLLTNAHCVDGELFIVYYSNVTGRREIAKINRVLYKGVTQFDDVALVEAPEKVKRELDAVSDSLQLRTFEKNEVVLLSALDPLYARPEIASLFPEGTPGAVLSVRRCLGQQRIPKLGKVTAQGNIVDISSFNPKNKDLDPGMHIFLDSCVNASPVGPASTLLGDSGGLISNERFDQFAGPFAWVLMKKEFALNEVFFGNRGRWLNVQAEMPGDPESSVVNTGALLAAVLQKNPHLKAYLPLYQPR